MATLPPPPPPPKFKKPDHTTTTTTSSSSSTTTTTTTMTLRALSVAAALAVSLALQLASLAPAGPAAAFSGYDDATLPIYSNAISAAQHVWRSLAPLPMPLSDMTATVHGDVIYVMGGCMATQGWNAEFGLYTCGAYAPEGANVTSSHTFAYHPKRNAFVRMADMPRQRYRHAAAQVGRYILLIGGKDAIDTTQRDVDVYDTSKNKWYTLAVPFADATADGTAFSVPPIENQDTSGRWTVYYTAGYNDSYAPMHQTYRLQASPNDIQAALQAGSGLQFSNVASGSLRVPRGDAPSVLINVEGKYKAYVCGGYGVDWSQPLSSMEIFDVDSETFELENEPLLEPRGDQTIAALDANVFLLGGEKKGDNFLTIPLKSVEIYDADSGGVFHEGGELNANRFRFAAATWRNSIFVFGGQLYLTGEWEQPGSYYALSNAVDSLTEFPAVPGLQEEIPVVVHGSGSVTPSVLVWKILDDFESRSRVPILFTYRAVGSAVGMDEIVGDTESKFLPYTDFGSSDVPLTSTSYAALASAGKDILQVPFMLSTVSVFVKLPEGFVDSHPGLRVVLDACTLAKIFSGQIQHWDAEPILERNRVLSELGRNVKINVVRRVDGASTTAALAEYLDKACPSAWPLGTGMQLNWPSSTMGLEGGPLRTAAYLADNDFSISYLESNLGRNASESLVEIALVNAAGRELTSREADVPGSVQAKLESTPGMLPATLQDDWSAVTFVNLGGDKAWPLTLASYIFVRKDLTGYGKSGTLLHLFLTYLVSEEGRQEIKAMGYLPLPNAMYEMVNRALTRQGDAQSARGVLELPWDAPAWFVETETQSQPYRGAQMYSISYKRNSYANLRIQQLESRTSDTQERLHALEDHDNDKDLHGSSASAVATAALIFSIVACLLCIYLLLVAIPAVRKEMMSRMEQDGMQAKSAAGLESGAGSPSEITMI